RKALFLNPVRMESIIGMEDKEALALIDELMRHSTQKKYEYRHKWRHGDWVLWANRSVMHQANPDYDMNERRYLYRLTLKGDTLVSRRLTPHSHRETGMIDCYTWTTDNGYKPRMMLEETGLPHKIIPVNLREKAQMTPEFLKISPGHKIPAIIDHDGPGGA